MSIQSTSTVEDRAPKRGAKASSRPAPEPGLALAPTVAVFGLAKALDSQSRVIEGLTRDAQLGVGAPGSIVQAPAWITRAIGWLGLDAQSAARLTGAVSKAAEVVGPIARFTGRVMPILSVAVAGLDAYNCWKTWQDPKVSQTDKTRATIIAGLSAVSAGAMVASVAFPPAMFVAIAAAGASVAIEHWDTITKDSFAIAKTVGRAFSGW